MKAASSFAPLALLAATLGLVPPYTGAYASQASSSASAPSPAFATAALEEWTTPDGDQLAYDGVFYSFRSADGLRAIKLWTPPQTTPIRGLLLFGNPGGGLEGDTRNITRQRDMLLFAAREGLAVAGLNGFPAADTRSLGPVILRGLAAIGARGHHPELAHVPLIASGGSNAGIFALGMLFVAPERMIALTPNVGFPPEIDLPPAARAVPMWSHNGLVDDLVANGVEKHEELFQTNAARGPVLWTWDSEIKGHANAGSDHVDMAFWEHVLAARLPASFTPGQPVPLNTIDPATGWYADFRTWDHRVTRVFPAAELPANAEPGRYGWLPSEALARLYQANATRSRALLLSLVDMPAPDLSGTSGTYLAAGNSIIVEPGQQIRLKITTRPMSAGRIPRLGLYDRGELLGEIEFAKHVGEFTFTVDPAKKLYALYAFTASDFRNGARISAPLQLLVNSPEHSDRIAEQLAARTLARAAAARAVAPPSPSTPPPALPYPADLIATPALDAAAESSLVRDGRLSPVWQSLSAPALTLDGTSFTPPVPSSTAQLGLTVRTAWSSRGLYFLYEIDDSTWTEPGKDQADTVDFYLSHLDPARLRANGPADVSLYAKPSSYSHLRGAVQYQIPVGAAAIDGRVSINFFDPWDLRSETWTAADAYAGTGFWADVVDLAPGRRALEVFIPWVHVGNPGLRSAPAASTRLTLRLAYKEGTRASRVAWPASEDPWRARPAPGPSSTYGQLLLLPPAR